MSEIYVAVLPPKATAGDLSHKIAMPELSANRVEEIGDSLAEIANKLRGKLERTISVEPTNGWKLEEVELKFTLDLRSEVGVVIARGSVGAGFEASLTWKAATQSRDA